MLMAAVAFGAEEKGVCYARLIEKEKIERLVNNVLIMTGRVVDYFFYALIVTTNELSVRSSTSTVSPLTKFPFDFHFGKLWNSQTSLPADSNDLNNNHNNKKLSLSLNRIAPVVVVVVAICIIAMEFVWRRACLWLVLNGRMCCAVWLCNGRLEFRECRSR